MKSKRLNLTELTYHSALIADYLKGAKALQPFYQYPFQFDAFKDAIEVKKGQRLNRKALADALLQQYTQLADAELSLANIELLRKETTFTITTAHQPNLFAGPLFTLYKILSAINIAEQLKDTYPQYDFVPVYWLGSEDHDFEEINHASVLGNTIRWQDDSRGAVGRLSTRNIQQPLNELAERLGKRPYAGALKELFNNAYLGGETFAEATQELIHRLFGRYGLVVMDQDDKALKTLFKATMQQAIEQHAEETAIINSTIQQLQKAGYKAQASPRDINFFYLDDGLRERIEWDTRKEVYKVVNSNVQFSKEELNQQLHEHPERFSPNVFYRPLYQESLLPNLAYVGGGGELAYWMELKDLFAHHHLPYPMLVLRSSLAVVDKNTCRKISQLELDTTDLFRDSEALFAHYVKANSHEQLGLEAEQIRLKQVFEMAEEKALEIDPTLQAAAEARLQKAQKAFHSLEKKMLNAEKKKHDIARQRIHAIKEKLFPGGVPQERVENFANYYSLLGPAFIDELKANIQPFNKELVLLFEEECPAAVPASNG